MKKMRVMLLLAFSTVLLVTGCGKKDDEAIQEPAAGEYAEIITDQELVGEAAPEVDEYVEELPKGMVRSSLTGEIISKDLAKMRPIAIMLPTDKAAQPQYGIGNAGVLYECMEEGDMSRQMAIIEDWQQMQTLGNVRSCRDYYVYWAMEWDPILVHFGGPYYLADVTSRPDVHNITGCAVNSTTSAPGANAFYRSNDKVVPHNAYTTGENLVKACEKLEYDLVHDWDVYRDAHFTYNTKSKNTLAEVDGNFDAQEVSLKKAFPYTKSGLTFNAETGLYEKSLYEAPQKDGGTGELLTFENVVIQFTHYEVRDAKGYLAFQCHDDQHDGYFITNGKAVHIRWNKSGDYSPTRYYYDTLDPVEFNIGKTYIAVVQDDRPVIIDGVEYSSDTLR